MVSLATSFTLSIVLGRRLTLLLALVGLGASGCGEASSHRYAATVLEPDFIVCEATPRTPFLPPVNLKQIVDAAQNNWRASHKFSPPIPQGRMLHVTVDSLGSVRGWFDSFGVTTDSLGNSVDEGPNEVYLGDAHDDYYDVTFRRTTNPSAFDQSTGSAPNAFTCGPLEAANANLTATNGAGELEGRIKRVESAYLGLGLSSCDVTVSCTRFLNIRGVEDK